ncbi:MAG: hypothetical protein VW862_03505 [Euryarchaeota archaeon]
MTNLWVVDSNCFIHLGSMAPEGFLSDIKDIFNKQSSGIYVTPGVHGEVKTVRFQRWKGSPNLLEQMTDILKTISVDEAEIRALASHIGEKASPQDVDLSLMILASKLSHEGNKVTLVSDDYKMTTTGEKANLNFETCPPSTFLQRLADFGSKNQRTRLRSLSRRVRAAEMRYAISRAGQYDIQAKLTWMVDSLLSTKVVVPEQEESSGEVDEKKLISGLIRTTRSQQVKKSILNKLGNLPEICSVVSKIDEHLQTLSEEGKSDNISQSYESCVVVLSEVLESTGIGLSPLGEEMAEIAHRAMAGPLYRMESAMAMLAKLLGEFTLSRLHLSRALAYATLIDDESAEMRAMHQLGLLALSAQNWDRAASLFETADRQGQMVGDNRIANLVLSGISRHLSGDTESAENLISNARDIISKDKILASTVLYEVGQSLQAIDRPGLALEIFDEAMECAIELNLNNELENIAEAIIMANAALSETEQTHFEGLRDLLDTLNTISEEKADEFESKIIDIEEKVEEISQPLKESWKEWQDSNNLIPEGSELTVLRVETDGENRTLIVTHHPEIGPVGIWLPDGGVKAASGNLIEIGQTRIKVAPPTEELSKAHNVRAILAIEKPECLHIKAQTDNLLNED